MLESLSQEERIYLLSLVTEEQRDFLQNKLKRGRETIFGNFMLSEKVSAIKSTDEIDLLEEEQDVVDWKIIKYHDYGFRNREGKCACGRTLRYEFTVQHSKTLKTITYGKDHLADFLSLEVKDINEVVNGLRVIDNELDEMLRKINNKDYGYEILDELSDTIHIPLDIQEHVEFNVPLLNRQFNRLLKIIDELEREEVFNRRKELLNEERPKSYHKVSLLIDERFKQEKNVQHVREQKLLEILKERLPINASLGELAYCLIQNGVNSSTEISCLIRNNYDVDKRISSGIMHRPYIYMDIVLACKEYAKKGLIIFDEESSGIHDCIYYMDYQDNQCCDKQDEIQTSLF
ncbi:hypothetical protein ACOMCU_16065 [Lysinibacillus sp. UGB7]|uniref:hypothetical protein n=1 Tax=Lysinibacillus sp. UGB7 TaxID=3411039 RepID=UPI003B795C8F